MVTELPHVSLIMVTEPPMTHPLHPLDSCEVHPLTVSYEIEDATRTSRQDRAVLYDIELSGERGTVWTWVLYC